MINLNNLSKCDLCQYYNPNSEKSCKKVGKDCKEAIENLVKCLTEQHIDYNYNDLTTLADLSCCEESTKQKRVRLNENK